MFVNLMPDRREEVAGRMTGIDRPALGGSRRPGVVDVTHESFASDDRILLERLRTGEDSAFGELFARHADAVRRLALGLAGDRAEAEDLTAEAFFRVLQAIRRGSGPVDNVRGYLLIVARRVAWEWQARRRDVPVSDEELTRRVGTNPDTAGQSTERNLITRAFTSLPERWRNVLWKVEVEGERPAVVATRFGLSPNATAALARRARQGLRAAYLQAHLAVDRGSTGCRSVLEKLGAYTAGSIRGTERRRIRAHLAGCASCTSMHDELREVCSGLRAHAAFIAAPVLAAGGLGAAIKGVLASTKVQVTVAASSAAAAGIFGMVIGPWGPLGDSSAAPIDLDGRGGVRLEITDGPMATTTTSTIAVNGGTLSTRIPRPEQSADHPGSPRLEPSQIAAPSGGTGGGSSQAEPRSGYDEDAPVVYRETSVEQNSETQGDYTLVRETTTVTEVNSANQTRVQTATRTYTRTADPPPDTVASSPTSTDPTSEKSAPESVTRTAEPRGAG